MLNQTTQATVCTHPSDRVHTPTHTQTNNTLRTVCYWNDGSLYWLPDGEEARRAERFEIYGETYKAAVPVDWTDNQITEHLQTVCTQPSEGVILHVTECVHTPTHS